MKLHLINELNKDQYYAFASSLRKSKRNNVNPIEASGLSRDEFWNILKTHYTKDDKYTNNFQSLRTLMPYIKQTPIAKEIIDLHRRRRSTDDYQQTTTPTHKIGDIVKQMHNGIRLAGWVSNLDGIDKYPEVIVVKHNNRDNNKIDSYIISLNHKVAEYLATLGPTTKAEHAIYGLAFGYPARRVEEWLNR